MIANSPVCFTEKRDHAERLAGLYLQRRHRGATVWEGMGMQMQIVNLAAQPLFALRVCGPFEQTLAAGFEDLMAWAARHGLRGVWLALYYDNPREVAPDALRADVALATTAQVALPEDGGAPGVRRDTLAGGEYALVQVQVTDNDFATPWIALFDRVLPASGYRPAGGPCFERYLNDGRESGVWLLELGVPVTKA